MPGKDIFLSYASADRERILPLVRALEGTGWAVFWDRTIPAGKTWRQVIGEEISGCRSVVVVWSRLSVERDWVQEEAEEGKRRRVLVPVLLDQVEPPFGFGAIQAADLVGWDGSSSAPPFRRLITDLATLLGRPLRERDREESPRGEREQEETVRKAPEEAKPHQALPEPARSRKRLGWTLAVCGLAGGLAVLWSVATRPLGPPVPAVGGGFRECAVCPEMVVIPAGEFSMGSPPDEKGRREDEGPSHPVMFSRQFAVGKYEVTFAEWDACVKDMGCSYIPADNGWGRDTRPVIFVSWDDAQGYVSWLSKETGQRYRLLSEAEWEYAARAGSKTPYPWGSEPGSKHANFKGSGSPWSGRQTAPVGQFEPNKFGLHDMIGNVLEWVQDCWNPSYEGAPKGGSAWETGKCGSRVLRGGAWWYFEAGRARSADRGADDSANRRYDVGLRVARTL